MVETVMVLGQDPSLAEGVMGVAGFCLVAVLKDDGRAKHCDHRCGFSSINSRKVGQLEFSRHARRVTGVVLNFLRSETDTRQRSDIFSLQRVAPSSLIPRPDVQQVDIDLASETWHPWQVRNSHELPKWLGMPETQE